jgi:RNA polymerase sigma-54 factor
MMHMEHRLAQTQTQRLMLTQKMQQAIQILQLSGLELEQYVQQEMETNPVLEQSLKDVEPPERAETAETKPSDDADVFDGESWDIDKYASALRDGPSTTRDFSINRDLDARRQYYEDSITKEESFTSQLLNQLQLVTSNARFLKLGEQIIGDIDDRGYFTGSLEDIAAANNASLDEAEAALHQVQRLDPPGVGARDIKECLSIQIDQTYPEVPELHTLVHNHLEDLERRQVPKIAKAMGITPERVEELKDLLSTLNPWPGHEYSAGPPQYVTPDVIVEKNEDEDDYDVFLVDYAVPSLRINKEYRQMLRAQLKGDEKKYLKQKMESAKWLIRNIEQRQQTILRIARAIVDVQREFLDKGVEHIKPLTLQEIADVVGVHEATVSRATRGKYMQTPQGLFELKYFFSPGLKRSDGGDAQSSKSVQSLIKKIIDEESKAKPLSDQKIANLLKEQGIEIARRTVTKYREQLGILPTNLRKEYAK